jgi:hypothetical protein
MDGITLSDGGDEGFMIVPKRVIIPTVHTISANFKKLSSSIQTLDVENIFSRSFSSYPYRGVQFFSGGR